MATLSAGAHFLDMALEANFIQPETAEEVARWIVDTFDDPDPCLIKLSRLGSSDWAWARKALRDATSGAVPDSSIRLLQAYLGHRLTSRSLSPRAVLEGIKTLSRRENIKVLMESVAPKGVSEASSFSDLDLASILEIYDDYRLELPPVLRADKPRGRHTFSFPKHIREAVSAYVNRAASAVDPRRFRQEPPYLTSLATRLIGVAYEGRDGSVSFESTIVDDRGSNAAEGWSGADLAITAVVADEELLVRKAILVQAKLGAVRDLSRSESSRLQEQIKKMKRFTRSPKILQIPKEAGKRVPSVISGRRLLVGTPFRSLSLGQYFTARVLPTLDGDTRPRFVAAVQDSQLTKLKVRARLKE